MGPFIRFKFLFIHGGLVSVSRVIKMEFNFNIHVLKSWFNNGIFYEFIEASKFYDKNVKRYNLSQVKKGVNYVIIISTNAGLWAYNIGDTI